MIKRQQDIINRFYHRHAFLAQYDIAKSALTLLSALHGVSFELVMPREDDMTFAHGNVMTDQVTLPPTLFQPHALAPFMTNVLSFDTVDAMAHTIMDYELAFFDRRGAIPRPTSTRSFIRSNETDTADLDPVWKHSLSTCSPAWLLLQSIEPERLFLA